MNIKLDLTLKRRWETILDMFAEIHCTPHKYLLLYEKSCVSKMYNNLYEAGVNKVNFFLVIYSVKSLNFILLHGDVNQARNL